VVRDHDAADSGRERLDKEIEDETEWLREHLGPDVPLHFTDIHPDWKMMDQSRTRHPTTLTRARGIALRTACATSTRVTCTDPEGGTTTCHQCGAKLIVATGTGSCAGSSLTMASAGIAACAAPASSTDRGRLGRSAGRSY